MKTKRFFFMKMSVAQVEREEDDAAKDKQTCQCHLINEAVR